MVQVKTAFSQIHNLAKAMWNWNMKNNKLEINTSIFIMLSSNDWTVPLIAVNLR